MKHKSIDKTEILKRLDKTKFYKERIPSLQINGKPEVVGLCPFHNDTNPSLSVNLDTGLYRCYACGAKGDVFTFHQETNGVDFLTALEELAVYTGVTDASKPKVVATFKYTDMSGNLLYTKERIEPGRNGKSKEFFFKHPGGNGRGCDPVLYRLPEIMSAKQIFIVEGEGKADLLHEWGLTATCLDSGSNSPWRAEYSEAFKDKESIVILPDGDKPGREYAEKIASALHDKVDSLKVVGLPELSEKGDIIDWAAMPGNDKEKLMTIIENTAVWNPVRLPVVDVVDKVDVVDVSYSNKNNNILDETIESALPVTSFPMECFSERFKQIMKKLSTSLNVDIDVCASTALSVLSGATGNTIRVSPKSGWEVSLFIWMNIIAGTGSGKTPVINCLMKPIDRRQARAYRKYQKLMTNYNAEMGMYRKDKNAALPEKPVLKHYKTSDYTIESLGDVFESQLRGVIIHKDELSGLVSGLNQYKSGKGNDRQHLLELFNGDPWKIDRKTGSRCIPNTGAAIIGGLQPQIMPKVFGHDSFDDGLLPRFLFVTASNKTQRFNRQGVTNDDLAFWYDLIEYCYEIPLKINPEGYVEPLLLIFSDDALNLWEGFYNEFHAIKEFLPNRVRVFIPKLITYSLKLAGILHVLKGFKSGDIGRVISEDTINDAIQLTRFYAGQVAKIVRQYNKSEPEINEYENIIIRALMNLQGEVKNLKLPLGRITEVVNTMLPEKLKFEDNKNIGSILRNLRLQTQKSTGGVYFLLWDDVKVKNLLKRTSTLSTNDEPFNGQF